MILYLEKNNIIKNYNQNEKITTPLILENNIYIYTQKKF
ncbi:Exodeoxyribonuclease V alpha chain [Borrelia duttonii CR2A]|uniref:Exodeoxyribonuclease V alpha chain n=1 Tax=Borrelia duttonii CR2A TaxID=1432657 RepID=W6TIA5_9SPIR|nr:Exodeoxyribonuclease V alpha chain [Borrelia duttonii CR2A]